MRLTATAVSDIGRVRKTNQDSVGCFDDLSLYLLSDGMGGLTAGEIASRIAIDVIRDKVAQGANGNGQAQDDLGVLRAAIARANESILQEGELRKDASGGRSRIGATIVALRLSPDAGRAVWAHVGDSRLYRYRGGTLTLLTADHTVAGAAYRDGEVPLDLPHTNMLVQALGVSRDIEPSVGSDDMRAGDLFLLCSDGVSGLVEPDALAEQLGRDATVEEKATSLIRLALEASGRDNASVVLVQILGD
jgi:protein phosphatase